jgi:Holliday junction resolvase RusA-like endonuclease
MADLIIEFPGVPVAKARARLGRNHNIYTPAPTAIYQDALGYAVRASMGRTHKRLTGPVELCLVVRLPIPIHWTIARKAAARAGKLRPAVKPDIDNFLKMVADACTGIAFTDDRQIVRSVVDKIYSDVPGIRFQITAMGQT